MDAPTFIKALCQCDRIANGIDNRNRCSHFDRWIVVGHWICRWCKTRSFTGIRPHQGIYIAGRKRKWCCWLQGGDGGVEFTTKAFLFPGVITQFAHSRYTKIGTSPKHIWVRIGIKLGCDTGRFCTRNNVYNAGTDRRIRRHVLHGSRAFFLHRVFSATKGSPRPQG